MPAYIRVSALLVACKRLLLDSLNLNKAFRRRHFKLTSTALIDQKVVVLAYEINEFILTDHKYGQLVLDSVKNSAAAIIIESNIKIFFVESSDRNRTRN